MAYLLDGAVILIFILFVWVGSRRGLVRSVLRLISWRGIPGAGFAA